MDAACFPDWLVVAAFFLTVQNDLKLHCLIKGLEDLAPNRD